MKKTILSKVFTFCLLFVGFGMTHAQQWTAVPDANFEAALEQLNPALANDENPGFVKTSLIATMTSLDVSNKNISNLQGIEGFTALKHLDCSRNQLSSLVLTSNTALITLNASKNQLSTIDISVNTALTFLNLSENQITSVNLSTLLSLSHAYLKNNRLTTVDISTNTSLVELNLSGNQIGSLNVATNTLLQNLTLSDNVLTSLDVSTLTNLTTLIVNSNSPLRCVLANSTQLNPIPSNWNSDPTTRFTIDCLKTAIPDPLFEQLLIDKGYDNILDGFITNANVENEIGLLIDNTNITNIKGIEAFSSIFILGIRNNPELINMDISGLKSLAVLSVQSNSKLTVADFRFNDNLEVVSVNNNNAVTEVKFGSNSRLINFDISGTSLTNLDLSPVKDLIGLGLSNTGLTSIDLSANTSLRGLTILNQPLLQNIDLSNNRSLQNIKINGTSLTTLDLVNSFALSELDVANNPNLTCVETLIQPPPTWIKDPHTVFSNNCGIVAKTYIPDDQFEQALIDLGLDDTLDDQVSTRNISQIKKLDVSNKNISSLQGIEDFTSLVQLNCSNNLLTELTLGVAFQSLNCRGNQLSQLNLKNAEGLVYLNCDENLLSRIDLSSNNQLTFLSLAKNKLKELSLINNSLLNVLIADHNQLMTLDFTSNTHLNRADVNFNQLSSINLSQNTSLSQLNISHNLLASIDLSANTNLKSLDASDNPLTGLNVGSITGLSYLFANNLSTSCIQVNNNQFTAIPSGWSASVNYSLNCNGTYIPDDNFEQALIDLGYDTVLDNYVATAQINTLTTLNISNKNIADPEGLQAFVALQNLNISGNQLAKLNLSVLPALTVMNAQNNPSLSCIQVSQVQFENTPEGWVKDATAKYSLDCDNTFVPDNNFELALIGLGYDDVLDDKVKTANINTITSLDISSKSIANLTGIQDFTALTNLNFSSNSVTSVDLTQNTNLTLINGFNNQLTSVNILNLTALTDVNFANNSLSSVNLSTNTALTRMSVLNNSNLFCIQVNASQLANIPTGWQKDVNATYSQNCNRTFVPDTNFEQALIDLGYDNILDDYVITGNIENLTQLVISNKSIANLQGIEAFTSLQFLDVRSNAITELDLRSNVALQGIACDNNQLTRLNVSGNPNLLQLLATNNQLSSLNVSNNTLLERLRVQNNSSLTCIQVNSTQLANIPGKWRKDAAASYSINCSGGSGGGGGSGRDRATVHPDSNSTNALLLYPNPSSNTLKVSLGKHTEADIVITDVNGKEILRRKVNTSSNLIDVSKVPDGIYFATMNTHTEKRTQKIIISN